MITWRVPVAAVVLVLCLSAIGYVVFPRPPQHDAGTAIKLPDHLPSNAKWVWPEGVPGWTPGETIKGFPVSGLQPIEVERAELAAAQSVLDASDVRVVDSIRPDRHGVLAVLATHALDEIPERTCLAGLLRNAPVHWVCPARYTLSRKLVFAVEARLEWPGTRDPIYLAGVARGDVTRIDLVDKNGVQGVYTRGKTWGQFDLAEWVSRAGRLQVYGKRGLLETISLDLPAGQQRVIR